MTKLQRIIRENVLTDIKVEFEQFVKMIGLELAAIDAHNVLMTILFTTSLS